MLNRLTSLRKKGLDGASSGHPSSGSSLQSSARTSMQNLFQGTSHAVVPAQPRFAPSFLNDDEIAAADDEELAQANAQQQPSPMKRSDSSTGSANSAVPSVQGQPLADIAALDADVVVPLFSGSGAPRAISSSANTSSKALMDARHRDHDFAVTSVSELAPMAKLRTPHVSMAASHNFGSGQTETTDEASIKELLRSAQRSLTEVLSSQQQGQSPNSTILATNRPKLGMLFGIVHLVSSQTHCLG